MCTMQRALRNFIMFSAFVGAVSLSAQTADDVVARHVAAVGGKDVISQVKSISMDTTTHIADSDMPGTLVTLDGVAYRSELDFNGAKMVQCYTAKGGWIVNPMAGITDPTPMPDDEFQAGKSAIYVGGGLHDYAANGNKLQLLGKDANTYTVKLTTKDNTESTYVFDAATYLVKSTSRKGKFQDQDVTITTSLSDYRKTDIGLVVPYAISIDFGDQFSLSITVNKVEVNKPVDPAICDLPKTSQPPDQHKPSPN
jgi:hypothetical protein